MPSPVHDRNAVGTAAADFDACLDPRTPRAQWHASLRLYLAEVMEAVAVGRYVGNLRSEGPRCLESWTAIGSHHHRVRPGRSPPLW
jgi:hypothetical protein